MSTLPTGNTDIFSTYNDLIGKIGSAVGSTLGLVTGVKDANDANKLRKQEIVLPVAQAANSGLSMGTWMAIGAGVIGVLIVIILIARK